MLSNLWHRKENDRAGCRSAIESVLQRTYALDRRACDQSKSE